MDNSEGKAGNSSDSAEVIRLREQLRLSIQELLAHPDVPLSVKEILTGNPLITNYLPKVAV